MNSKQNILIATLTITSFILLAMVFVGWSDSGQAQAASVSAAQGDYVMVPGKVGGKDFIYVVCIPTKTLILYAPDRANPANASIVLVDKYDLQKLFPAQ